MTGPLTAGTLPAKLPRGREAERMVYAETLGQLRATHATMTEFMERFQGRTLNHVLRVETAIFDATGAISRSFATPAGCIQLDNPGTHPVTISSAGNTGTAPLIGVGVYVIKAGTNRTVALGSATLTIYGTTGDTISFQIFSEGAQPVVG